MKKAFSITAAMVLLAACSTPTVRPPGAANVQVTSDVEQAAKRAQEVIQKSGLSDGPFGVF
jgi:outer membrane biogenesis lipoprotein LolB